MSEMLFSNVAERGVLSGILHDPVERFDVVLEQVPEGGFYFEQNIAAFEVLLDMRASHRPIEPRAFVIRAADMGKLQAMGGEQAVNDLVAHRPTTLHFSTYLHTLKEKRAMRQLNAYADWLKGQVYEPGNDPAELVELAQVKVTEISLERGDKDPRHVGEVLDEIDADLKEHMKRADAGHKIAGLETGLARVDEILGGIERGERRVITGLSNAGKTWREMQIVKKVSDQGERVLLFMLDGKDKEAIIRLYADVAGVELGFLLSGTYKLEDRNVRLERLAQAKRELTKRGIFIDDSAHSIQEINAITRRMVKKQGITGTCIDFFGRCISVGFKLNDKVAMLSSVADQWARCIDDHKGKLWGVMLAQAHQNDIKVGQAVEKGPGALKDCKTLYDVATKGEGLSRELRDMDTLKSEEKRIPDTDRNAAPPLRADEQIVLNTIIKSKTTRLGEVWIRLMGNMGRITDFDPNAKIGDPRTAAMGRLIKQVEQGAPNYGSRDYQGPRGRPRKDGAAPPPDDELPEPELPKPRTGAGPSMYGPLTITRPNRPKEGEP
jgi:replicative DNA helicase